jgi:hypothetical protein
MHTHVRGTELKIEEELQQCEEALKKWEEELRIQEEQFEKCATSFHLTSWVAHYVLMQVSICCNFN